LSQKDYEFSDLKDNIIRIKLELKKKGKEYGLITMPKEDIKILGDVVHLMASSPDIAPKFRERVGQYLFPKLNEIMGIIAMNKTLPEQISVEFSKADQKAVLKGFKFSSIIAHLALNKINYQEIVRKLKEIKMEKYKGK
jgi:hypothetical protein